MGKGGGTEVTQQQQSTQQTEVTVNNIIQDAPKTALENVKLLAEVFSVMDSQNNTQKPTQPATVLSISNIPSAAYLSNPMTLGMIIFGVLGGIYLLKRRK